MNNGEDTHRATPSHAVCAGANTDTSGVILGFTNAENKAAINSGTQTYVSESARPNLTDGISTLIDGVPSLFVETLIKCKFLDIENNQFILHGWADHNTWQADADARSGRNRFSRLGRMFKGVDAAHNVYELLRKNGISTISEDEYKAVRSLYDEGTDAHTVVATVFTKRTTPIPIPIPIPNNKKEHTTYVLAPRSDEHGAAATPSSSSSAEVSNNNGIPEESGEAEPQPPVRDGGRPTRFESVKACEYIKKEHICSIEEALAMNKHPPAVGFTGYFLPIKSKHGQQVAFIKEENWRAWVEAFGEELCSREIAKAYAWCRDNPAKVKTPNGLHKFLGGWLARVHNKGRGGDYGNYGNTRNLRTEHPGVDRSVDRDKIMENTTYSETEQQRLQELFQVKSKIPKRYHSKTFENFDSAFDPSAKRVFTAIKAYANKFINEYDTGRSVVFHGKNGTGKTHLACAVMRHIWMVYQFTSLYSTVSNLVREVHMSYDASHEEDEQSIIDKYIEPHLLVLDEVGMQKNSDSERSIINDVIGGRYNAVKPTIVISNLDKNDVVKYIGGRIMDRLKENGGFSVDFNWESHRK
jgi:DNA replication protein DnaC